jgi:opacity protein-like surface antigen
LKKIILAAAVAAVALMALAATASADVPRYQTQTMTITAVQPKDQVGQWQDVWTHTYTVTLNPCDSSFTGTGSVSGTDFGFLSTEKITGHLDGNKVSFTATRDSDGVVYSLSNAPLDNSTVMLATSTPSVSWRLEFHVSATTIDQTHYKNHGDYVSSQGGGADAAHSCIGMPVK